MFLNLKGLGFWPLMSPRFTGRQLPTSSFVGTQICQKSRQMTQLSSQLEIKIFFICYVTFSLRKPRAMKQYSKSLYFERQY